MNSKKSTSSSGGVGFFSLLGLLFIGLKLGGVITWPWLWVVAPIWAPLCAAIVVIIVVAAWWSC